MPRRPRFLIAPYKRAGAAQPQRFCVPLVCQLSQTHAHNFSKFTRNQKKSGNLHHTVTNSAKLAKLLIILVIRGFRFLFPRGSVGSSPIIRTNNLQTILEGGNSSSVDYRWTF